MKIFPSHSIMIVQCNTCQTFTENGNNCSVCQLWNCKDCIICKEEYNSNISIYFCDMCNRNQNPESRATCWVCETIENIEECNGCNRWTCVYHFCTECFNTESRATCGVCELIDNIEEGADCHKCHHWTCSECVSFGDDGNYFCQECAK